MGGKGHWWIYLSELWFLSFSLSQLMCFSAGLPCDTICNDVVSQCPSLRVITPPIHRDHILNMLEQVSARQSTLHSFYRYILLYLLQETNLLMWLNCNYFGMTPRLWVSHLTDFTRNSQMPGMQRVWNGTDRKSSCVRCRLRNDLWVAYDSFINAK